MFGSSRWPLLLVVLSTATLCHAEPPDQADRVAISGRVIDEQSRGVAGVTVRGVAYTDRTTTTTDETGRFILRVIKERVNQLVILADDGGQDRMGTYRARWTDPPDASTPIQIQLVAGRSLPVVVSDANGEAVEGARVGALVSYASLVDVMTDSEGKAVLKLPTDAEIQSLYAVRQGVGFDYRVVQTPRDEAHQAKWLDEPPVRFQLTNSQTVRIKLVDPEDNPISGEDVSLWLLYKPGEPDSFNLSFTPTIFRATTDQAGVAEFRGVPDWNVHPLTFWSNTEEFVRERITFDPKDHADGKLSVRLDRLVPVTGRVQYGDGRPASDVGVSAVGAGYKIDGFREMATSNQEGHFEMRVAPNLLYMFAVQPTQWAAAVIDGLVVRPDEPVEGLVFELRPSTGVHGRVTVGPDQKPVAGQRMSLRQEGRDLHNLEGVELPNPENSRRWVQPSVYRWAETDEDGRFEFFVGPGRYTLSGPTQLEAKKFEVVNESQLAFDFASPRPERGQFTGRVVTGDPPRAVAGAIIEGIYRAALAALDLRLRADEQGRFSGERELHTVVLRAMSPDGHLGGILQVGPDETGVTIPIGPLASARARLIDAETGDPLPNRDIRWGRNVHMGDDDAPWMTSWGGTVTTDPSGSFEIRGLVVGQEYSLSVPIGDGRSTGLSTVTPQTATLIELGDLELKPPYRPPTFEERVDRELAADGSADERYDRALHEAERLRQHLLVVFLDRDAPVTESWFKLRLDDRQVRSALPNYQLIQLDARSAESQSLARRLGVTIDGEKLPFWWFSDSEGKPLGSGPIPHRVEDGVVDRAAILERLAHYAPEPLDARQLLKDALAEAATSNRRVIVQETATWCGPCHMLARYLERHRSIWEKDYLWIRVDQRWHGSDEVMNRIKEGYRGGIPWYAILDSRGQVLATSDGPDGNIGFPSEPASIDHFMGMIKSTRQRISGEELAALREGLESR